MLFKKKKKKFSFNFLKKFKSIFKRVSVVLLVFELIIGFSIIFFYYSSQFYQTYPISDIFSRLNSIQKNVTGFNLKKIDE